MPQGWASTADGMSVLLCQGIFDSFVELHTSSCDFCPSGELAAMSSEVVSMPTAQVLIGAFMMAPCRGICLAAEGRQDT